MSITDWILIQDLKKSFQILQNPGQQQQFQRMPQGGMIQGRPQGMMGPGPGGVPQQQQQQQPDQSGQQGSDVLRNLLK